MTQASTSAPTLPPLEIFAAGRHRAVSGLAFDFSAEDLAGIAARYNPALSEAPHVIGHPKTDSPAWGWVGSLAVSEAGCLVAGDARQVEAQFADLVQAGRYKKRSAAFFHPEHPNNPTPGHWYLKHVGWLGAVPPAVKGLADAAFADAAPDPAPDQVVEFADWADEVNAGLWRRMREWFIGQFGADTADKVIPSWDVDALQRDAMQPEPEVATARLAPGYADPPAQGDLEVTDPTAAARTAELDAREARIREQEAALAGQQLAARNAAVAEFADEMVQQGRLLPPERAALVAALQGLPAELAVEFADGDNTVSRSPVEVIQGFIKGLPPRVDFSERAPNGNAGSALDLNDAHAIARAAQEFADAEGKAGRSVSFDVAVAHVTRQAEQA